MRQHTLPNTAHPDSQQVVHSLAATRRAWTHPDDTEQVVQDPGLQLEPRLVERICEQESEGGGGVP